MFLPNSQSFLLARKGKRKFFPNSCSFLLVRSVTVEPVIQAGIQEAVTSLPPPSLSDSGKLRIRDKNKRTFLKAAGVASFSLVASLFLPKKAEAFIMGSSPTTGVVGVKDSTNARINPATEETLDEVLKTTDLAFTDGALQVKVTSVSGVGSSSFSNSAGTATSGLVDDARHVQVDVLSSALPTTASTETTLQTIAFGGKKYALRLATVGSIDYVGEADINTLSSASDWRVKKIDSTSGIIIQWAGTGGFAHIWDNGVVNYEDLTYS